MSAQRVCEICLRTTVAEQCPHHPHAELLDEERDATWLSVLRDKRSRRVRWMAGVAVLGLLGLLLALAPSRMLAAGLVLGWSLFMGLGVIFPLYAIYNSIPPQRRAPMVWWGLSGSVSLMVVMQIVSRHNHDLSKPVRMLLSISSYISFIFCVLLVIHLFTRGFLRSGAPRRD